MKLLFGCVCHCLVDVFLFFFLSDIEFRLLYFGSYSDPYGPYRPPADANAPLPPRAAGGAPRERAPDPYYDPYARPADPYARPIIPCLVKADFFFF